MQYGTDKETKILDDNGSTETTATNYVKGKIKYPIRRTREIRHRTDKNDLLTLSKIANDLLQDKYKLDSGIRIERPKDPTADFYYLVEYYTLLEY